MLGRDIFIDDLLDKIDTMIAAIEDREHEDADLNIARELAEQLYEEVESLQQ